MLVTARGAHDLVDEVAADFHRPEGQDLVRVRRSLGVEGDRQRGVGGEFRPGLGPLAGRGEIALEDRIADALGELHRRAAERTGLRDRDALQLDTGGRGSDDRHRRGARGGIGVGDVVELSATSWDTTITAESSASARIAVAWVSSGSSSGSFGTISQPRPIAVAASPAMSSAPK